MLLTEDWRTGLAALSVLVGFLGNIDYWRAIRCGRIKPHLFTWLIWGMITTLVAVAQEVKGAGAGNWAMITTAGICFLFAWYAWRQGEKQITRGDWICLLLAFAAIPLWGLTGDPIWSVICVCVIDLLGFYPTARKSWGKPWEEKIRPYLLANLKFFLGLLALAAHNPTTMLYPIFIIAANTAFIMLLVSRRRHYAGAASPWA